MYINIPGSNFFPKRLILVKRALSPYDLSFFSASISLSVSGPKTSAMIDKMSLHNEGNLCALMLGFYWGIFIELWTWCLRAKVLDLTVHCFKSTCPQINLPWLGLGSRAKLRGKSRVWLPPPLPSLPLTCTPPLPRPRWSEKGHKMKNKSKIITIIEV